MNSLNHVIPGIAVVNRPGPVHPKSFPRWILLVLLLTLGVARADKQDDDYLGIYGLIDQADTLSASGKTNEAHAKYIEAQWALAQFQRANPNWNAKTVTFRLNYLADKVAGSSGSVPASATRAAGPAVKKPAAPVAKSPVKLLDAGREPRTVLRLHPAVGDKQTLLLNMKMAMAISMAGQAMPSMDIPAMVMTMDLGVKDIAANGDITYELVFSDASVVADPNTPPAVAAAIKTSLGGVRGLTGTGRMSDHGVVQGMEVKLPASADPQLSQTLEQMKESFSSSSTPLPAEAVGPGAKWEYKTRIKSQGMTIDQTMVYELVASEGDRLTLRSTITQNAANQKIQNPSMPGLKVDLTRMTGAGTGSSTFDLARIMPVSGTLAEKADILMSIPVGQQKQAMAMKMDMHITLESK